MTKIWILLLVINFEDVELAQHPFDSVSGCELVGTALKKDGTALSFECIEHDVDTTK